MTEKELKELKERNRQKEELQIDRKLNAQFSLWNAIITLNGLIIGGISILFILNPKIDKITILIVFAAAFFSIFILTLNYFLIRNFYSSLEEITPEYVSKFTDSEYEAEKQKGIKKAKFKNRFIDFIEKFAICLTFLNIFLILFLISTSK